MTNVANLIGAEKAARYFPNDPRPLPDLIREDQQAQAAELAKRQPLGVLLSTRRTVGLYNPAGECLAHVTATEEDLALVTLHPGWTMRDL